MVTKPQTAIKLIEHDPNHHISLRFYESMIANIISRESIPLSSLTVITVDSEYLRRLHHEFLNDNRYTDVMTFQLGDEKDEEAEIYISLENAKINSKRYGVELAHEVARLVIHGLLHLKGFDDQTEKQRQMMREKEEDWLRTYWEN
jgi:rRNA maturation RNase YbeY